MILGVSAVAARLQVGRKTIQRWADRGLFPTASRDERGRRLFDAAEVEQIRDRLFASSPIRVVDPYPTGRQTATTDGRIGVSETARRCGVTCTTVQAWADSGVLPSVRNERNERRFLEADVAGLAAGGARGERPAPVRRTLDLIDTEEY